MLPVKTWRRLRRNSIRGKTCMKTLFDYEDHQAFLAAKNQLQALAALLFGSFANGEPRASQQLLVPPAMAQTRAANPYEELASDPVAGSSVDRSAFVKSPSSWFLPNLKKWPRFPVTYGKAPALTDYALPDEIEDDVKRGASSQWLPSFMGTSAKNLRVDMAYMDEMHPRYTPIKNQRLLKVLG